MAAIWARMDISQPSVNSDWWLNWILGYCFDSRLYEPPRDKTNKVSVRLAKTQISLGIRPVWSESSLSAWRKLGPLATHWAHSENSDQTVRKPRLIWVFAGRTLTLLVLSRGGSYCNLHFHGGNHVFSFPTWPCAVDGTDQSPLQKWLSIELIDNCISSCQQAITLQSITLLLLGRKP